MTDLADIYALFRQHPCVCSHLEEVSGGCLFFAKNKADAVRSLKKGASWAITDDTTLASTEKCLVVPSVPAALDALSAKHRRQFEIPLIAVIETSEERLTSTLIASVLSTHYTCHFDQNKESRVALLGLNEKIEVAVLSCRAERPGELHSLLSTIKPTHGILPHLSEEPQASWVAKEMLNYFSRHHGCAFVDLSALSAAEFRGGVRMCVGYKCTEAPRPEPGIIEVAVAEQPEGLRVTFFSDENAKIELHTTLPPTPANARAVLAAIVIGIYFKVPIEKNRLCLAFSLKKKPTSNNGTQMVQP